MATVTSSLSPLSSLHPNSPSTIKSKPLHCFSCFLTTPNCSSPPLISSLTLSKQPPYHFKFSQNPSNQTLIITLRKPRNLRASTSASAEDTVISETTEQIVSATSGDDGISNVISILLFIAFIALSVVTIGVIYIAVTDFLQKREKEKFEKEEAAKKKKKGGKKAQARARAGPRGFGQKIEEEDAED